MSTGNGNQLTSDHLPQVMPTENLKPVKIPKGQTRQGQLIKKAKEFNNEIKEFEKLKIKDKNEFIEMLMSFCILKGNTDIILENISVVENFFKGPRKQKNSQRTEIQSRRTGPSKGYGCGRQQLQKTTQTTRRFIQDTEID
jgi:hypothetical protein